MKFKLLKDVKIVGVQHKAGQIFEVDPKTDRIKNNVLHWCFGHGTDWDFVLNKDIIILPESKKSDDLLEALKNLLAAFRIIGTQKDYDTYSAELYDAEQAIAKVEGKGK